jgi:penicillin-binding protein 2
VFERRLGILYAILCAGLLIVLARLAHLQVFGQTPEDPDAVLRKPLPLEEVPAPRGRIMDRFGVVLAEDEPVLTLAMDYSEMLLLDAMRGEPVSDAERGRLRRIARSRLSQARKQESPETVEREILYRALGDSPEPGDAATLRSLAEARLNALSLATGRSHDDILGRIESTLSRTRAIRDRLFRLKGIRMIHEETVPQDLVGEISVEAASVVEANPRLFPGVVVRMEHARRYPMGNIAPHVVGYLDNADRPAPGEVPEDPNVRPGERIGLTGVEKQYNFLLRGEPGILNETTDKRTGLLARNVLFPARPGSDLRLSLDSEAQRRAEAELQGNTGAVVVMDVRTGELLVLASAPRYDNNDVAAAFAAARADPSYRPLLSRAIQDSVPSGSIIKPIVALAACAEGVSPGWTVDCEGALTVAGTRFGCSGTHGRLDMTNAITQSCNVYFYSLARRIGPGPIVALAGEMGLGRRTGVDLPYEWPGRMPDPSRPGWYVGHTLNLSIGQGDVSVTPIQIAVAMAAVATGGNILQPTILHRVDPTPDPELFVRLSSPVVGEVPLPSNGLRTVREGMRGAALRGTASRVPQLAEMRAACKTGTAETADPAINHAWIAGYLPWDNPRYAFAVVLHNVPGHGGEVAGPIAAAVLETVLKNESRGE